MGLSEIRCLGAGKMQSDEETIIFSGGEKHEYGMALVLAKMASRCVLGYWPVSDCKLRVRLRSQPFNISIIQVYAPTSESTDEEIEEFYEHLDHTKEQSKT